MDHDVDLRSMDNEELRTVVEERETYLEETADFISGAVVECGTQVYDDEGASWSKYRWELNGFHGFDFEYRHGMDTLYSKEYLVSRDGQTVLSLRRDDAASPVSVRAHEDGEWQERFDILLDDPETAFQQYEAELAEQAEERRRRREERRKERERRREREELLEDAERLGLGG